MFHGLASHSPVRFYTFPFPEFCHVSSLRHGPLSSSEYLLLLETVGGHSGAVSWLTRPFSPVSGASLLYGVAVITVQGYPDTTRGSSVIFRSRKPSVGWKNESKMFAEVKFRAGISLWWLHHRTETCNFSFIGHCKSVTSLPSSQILLGTLLQEISCPSSANDAGGVTFLLSLSGTGGNLSSRSLKTPFPRHLCQLASCHICVDRVLRVSRKRKKKKSYFHPFSFLLNFLQQTPAWLLYLLCVSQAMASVIINLLCQLE